jgi:hypothetical protein
MALGSTQPLNRNEYQEYFLGVKAAGAKGRQPYHLRVPIVLTSGSLKLLEPSGPVKACNGIALPLPRITHRLLYAVVILPFFFPTVLGTF